MVYFGSMNELHLRSASVFGVLLAALGLLATGCSSPKEGSTQSGQSGEKETYLTGSYLKQDVSKHGEITNGKDNVRVLDRDKIDQSGAADVNEFLRTQGVR